MRNFYSRLNAKLNFAVASLDPLLLVIVFILFFLNETKVIFFGTYVLRQIHVIDYIFYFGCAFHLLKFIVVFWRYHPIKTKLGKYR